MAYFQPIRPCCPLTLPVRGTPHWPTLSPTGDFSTAPPFYHTQANTTHRRKSLFGFDAIKKFIRSLKSVLVLKWLSVSLNIMLWFITGESDLRPTYPEDHEFSENTKKFFLQMYDHLWIQYWQQCWYFGPLNIFFFYRPALSIILWRLIRTLLFETPG